MTDNTNPGNFANRPHEEVVEIAKKGGQASGGGGGGSAATPKEKVQETASKGGKAPKGGSSDGDSEDSTDTGSDNATEAGRTATGQFEKGGEAAKEAGRKGGLSS